MMGAKTRVKRVQNSVYLTSDRSCSKSLQPGQTGGTMIAEFRTDLSMIHDDLVFLMQKLSLQNGNKNGCIIYDTLGTRGSTVCPLKSYTKLYMYF